MAPALLTYLGIGSAAPVSSENTAVRALPAQWYTSKEMYELERRAIFSRKWLLTTHSLRLKNAGDYLRYDIAGYQILLCRDREGNINGFHNVCRHRAYPVVAEEKGTARILACRYHGWSYGLNGKLAKAPGYQELDGFDKNKNGLFPIHVHIDDRGFIWVNLDGKEKAEVSWRDEVEDLEQYSNGEKIDFDDYDFHDTWEVDGDYNWKILADNYNECYHYTTQNLDLPSLSDLQSYSVSVKNGHIQRDANLTSDEKESGSKVASTYFFPNASLNISSQFFLIQRIIPTGPLKSTMRYEVYRKRNASDESLQLVDQVYKRISAEDKALCEETQKNLNAGTFINGELHPRMEKGAVFFQKSVRECVELHHKREQAAKQDIWPARQQLPATAQVTKKDLEFCSGLACGTSQEQITW